MSTERWISVTHEGLTFVKTETGKVVCCVVGWKDAIGRGEMIAHAPLMLDSIKAAIALIDAAKIVDGKLDMQAGTILAMRAMFINTIKDIPQ